METVEKSAVVVTALKAGQQVLHDLDSIILNDTIVDIIRYGTEQFCRLGAAGVAAYGVDKATSYVEELILPKCLRGALPLLAATIGTAAAIHYFGNYMNVEQGTDLLETAKQLTYNYRDSITKLVTFNPTAHAGYLTGALLTLKSSTRLLKNVYGTVAHYAEKKKAEDSKPQPESKS